MEPPNYFVNLCVFIVIVLGSTLATREIQPKRLECGGAITSDDGVVEYPGLQETLIEGETCIWTIHLNSTKDFVLNFTKFDVRSNSPSFDCSDGGMRIYSLANEKELNNSYT